MKIVNFKKNLELQKKIADMLKWYIIDLLGISKTTTDFIGTGTLIKIKQLFGILTTKHVSDKLRGYDEIGFGISKKIHYFNTSVKYIQFKNLIYNNVEIDLSIIITPIQILETIKAKKSFCNLVNEKSKILNIDYRGLWCLVGGSGIETREEVISNNSKIKIIKNNCYFGGVNKPYIRNGVDYIDLKVDNKNNDLPEDFYGLSGGSLWQIQFINDIDNIDFIFAGVPIKQIKNQEDYKIVCYGVKTIYDILLNTYIK